MSELFASKKFKASLVGVAVSVLAFGLNKAGVGITTEQLLTILGPLLVYIGAQGVADMGKEKEKISMGGGEKYVPATPVKKE